MEPSWPRGDEEALAQLADLAHDVAKAGPISLFFTGKTGVLCSGNSQPMMLQDVVSKMRLRALGQPSKNTGFSGKCAP